MKLFLHRLLHICSTILIVAIAVGSVGIEVAKAEGYPELVNVAYDGGNPNTNDSNSFSSISADGRYVAFYSNSTNLVLNDASTAGSKIFVRDRQTGTTKLLNVGYGLFPVISANGRFVSFTSSGSELNQEAPDGLGHIFVYDLQTDATERVSVSSNGAQANNGSIRNAISADGRFVAFSSAATNLVANDTNNQRDVFVRDRQTGVTERVNVSSNGDQANLGVERDFDISPDGRYVVFDSIDSNLVANDTNDAIDVFIHDRQTGTTELVSTDSNGLQGNGASNRPFINANGRYVVFTSSASNLVTGDTNQSRDVFVHDRQTGQTQRVNVATDGTQTEQFWNTNSAYMSSHGISDDGRFVFFATGSPNLVPDDTNGQTDVFVRDRQTGMTQKVSQGPNASTFSSMSPSGKFVTYLNNSLNIYITEIVPPRTITTLAPARVWVSRGLLAIGLRLDVLVEAYKDGTLISSGQVNSLQVGGGFNNATLTNIAFNTFSPVDFPVGSELELQVSVRNACSGSLRNAGNALLWYNDSAANSRFGATVGETTNDYFLRNSFALATSAGTGPRQSITVASGARCSAFKPFGTWTITP